MPPLVRRYVKTSLVFLLAGLGLGTYVLVNQFLLGRYPPRLLVTAHAHLLLVGFLLMMVMGVATWMFPRPGRDDTRYRPGRAEAAYWLLTVGTGLRAAAEVAAGLTGRPELGPAIAAGGLAQLAGAVAFAANIWWRVRMPAPGRP
jgi:cbb3-type cytochrome oxidase subunit 1